MIIILVALYIYIRCIGGIYIFCVGFCVARSLYKGNAKASGSRTGESTIPALSFLKM